MRPVALGRGLFGQETTRVELQACLLNAIRGTYSLLIVLAAVAVGRESRQVRNAARIPPRLPVVTWLHDGRTLIAAATGLLARQSLMSRSRSLLRVMLFVLAAIVSALPYAASAQQTTPPLQMPDGLMPRQSPSRPPTELRQPLSAASSVSDTRTAILTLHDLGAREPLMMSGTSPIQGVPLGLSHDEVVTEARLSLVGAMSSSLIGDASSVTVTLNEQYVGTIPVTAKQSEFGPLEMPVKPIFFQQHNRLNFHFSGRYTQDCNDALSSLLWSTVSEKSTLTLTLARLPPRRELTRLPLPFFDDNVRRKLVLPFAVVADPSNEVLRASAIVASWFGKLADFRGTRFPVDSELPTEGNAVFVALASDVPAGLDLPPVRGPLVAEVANPRDALATILIVTGRDGAEVVAAANTLSLGSRALSGPAEDGGIDAIPVHKPYDAPAWIPTDRPVRFGELVDASTLQGFGYVPGTLHVPFRTSPDLYTWRHRRFRADINFRAPPGPVIDVAKSRLDVSINDMFLRSYSLAPGNTTLDWVMREAGFVSPLHDTTTPIPLHAVFGQNDLQMFFDTRPLERVECSAIPDNVRTGIDPDSTLDLSNAHHVAALPNLAFFAGSGFPFTRMADLSETLVVLSRQPSPLELTAFLGLMGDFGAMTFQPVNRIGILRIGDAGAFPDKDLLLISTLGDVGDAAALLKKSPYRVDGGKLRRSLPRPLEELWHWLGSRTSGSRRQAVATLSTPLDEQAAALIGAEAPGGNSRSVVALLAGSPEGLDAIVDSLRNPGLAPNIQGDLALLAGGTMTSYRAGTTYTVGKLPFWLWPEWWLQDQLIAIIAIMITATAGMGISLYRLLYWRAGRRGGGVETGRLSAATRPHRDVD